MDHTHAPSHLLFALALIFTLTNKNQLQGANPYICDRIGRTPLHYACFLGDVACITTLLDSIPSRYATNATGDRCAFDCV